MVMVRKTTLKTRILGSFAFSLFIAAALVNNSYATTCTINNRETDNCTSGTNFQVKVPEVLTVSLTTPNSWAAGDAGVFLRNLVTLEVISNNPAGITASMTTNSTTTEGSALANTYSGSSSTIPMLTADWTRSNESATNFWGYSTNDDSETGTYSAIALKGATVPSTVIPSGSTGTVSKNVYFGAKADTTKDSGTYSNTVVISVVSGTITEDNPVTPVDPAKPSDTNTNNPTYDNTNNRDRTVYTATTSNDSSRTTTLEVSQGDTRDAYSAPAGVTTTKINDEGTPLATGLAITAVVAAVAGVAFFVVARRHDKQQDDGDEY